MDQNTEINRVAIVGTGLIGGSWAACFLAHGLDVVATDPAPEAKDKVRHQVQAAWPALTKLGLAPGASTSRLRFESSLEAALEGADMVQENALNARLLRSNCSRTSTRSFHRLPSWRRVHPVSL